MLQIAGSTGIITNTDLNEKFVGNLYLPVTWACTKGNTLRKSRLTRRTKFISCTISNANALLARSMVDDPLLRLRNDQWTTPSLEEKRDNN
jgi:hypothetical protein